MSPTSPANTLGSAALPTRSAIGNWGIAHLDDAAVQWSQTANESEQLFEQHRQNVAAPGGSDWLGQAKDAAWRRITGDLAVVGRQSQTLRACADTASSGANDLRSAQRAVMAAIDEAEADGFRVGDDLSVTDTQRRDLSTAAARQTAAVEHADYIRWRAEQLIQTDTLVGSRLSAKAAELEGIRFEPTGHDDSIQMLDEKRPKDEPLSDARRRAVEYADQWAGGPHDPHRHNPDYANFGDGGGDCTNFASQVMRAGGFKDVGDGLDDWHRGDIDDWYYNNGVHFPGNDRSNTWSVAKDNHDFITQQSGRGEVVGTAPMPTRAALDPLAPSKAGLVPGDLIYYKDANGQINHTAVYVGQKMENGVLVDVVDQHANGDNNFRNDWMPDGRDFLGGSANAEFVHLKYPGE